MPCCSVLKQEEDHFSLNKFMIHTIQRLFGYNWFSLAEIGGISKSCPSLNEWKILIWFPGRWELLRSFRMENLNLVWQKEKPQIERKIIPEIIHLSQKENYIKQTTQKKQNAKKPKKPLLVFLSLILFSDIDST